MTAHAFARHQRNYGRGHQILNLAHYLDVLEKKPGAMAGSTPLEQRRQAGRWPESLDRNWKKLEERYGKSGAVHVAGASFRPTRRCPHRPNRRALAQFEIFHPIAFPAPVVISAHRRRES